MLSFPWSTSIQILIQELQKNILSSTISFKEHIFYLDTIFYFFLKKMVMGTPVKSKFSLSLFSKNRL